MMDPLEFYSAGFKSVHGQGLPGKSECIFAARTERPSTQRGEKPRGSQKVLCSLLLALKIELFCTYLQHNIVLETCSTCCSKKPLPIDGVPMLSLKNLGVSF